MFIAAFVAASALVPVVPPSAGATLVKRTPVVIETRGSGCALRTYTLRFPGQGSGRIADSGPAVCVVESRTADVRGGRERQTSGTELLEGVQGTLTVRWRGTQVAPAGRWGAFIGTWSIVSATGTYADKRGRGRFLSDGTFAAMRYLGLLITAV